MAIFDKYKEFIKFIHNIFIFNQRVDVLSNMLTELIPRSCSVLDIGCGNGKIGQLIMNNLPSVYVQGIEVLQRPDCLIKCKSFDGIKVPFEDSSFDLCMFVDVLHHTAQCEELLREAYRVSRKYILIKDHLCETSIDFTILKFMDWIGNRPHDVNLTYTYKSKRSWIECFSNLNLQISEWNDKITLYPFPFNQIFGRNLHYIVLLEKENTSIK